MSMIFNIQKETYKTIKYFGQEIEVPEWVKFISVDDTNNIEAFKEKPEKGFYGWVANHRQQHAVIGTVFELEDGLKWQDTLREVI